MRLPDYDSFRVPVGPGAAMVERYGYGEDAVVLLHGFGTNSFLWRHVGPELAVAQCAALAFDLFGYGASDRPFDADFGIQAQSRYLAAALETLGVSRPTIVASDTSTLIALRLAFDSPAQAGRLVLISPMWADELPGAQIRLMQRETALHLVRLVRGLFGAEPLIRVLLESGVSNPESLSPRLVGRYVAPFLGREGVNHLLALASALEGNDLGDVVLGKIRHPTLILHGTADQWCQEGVVRRLTEEMPNARIEVVPGVGRLIAEENPGALVDAILAHIGNPGPA